jgi:hypothetical protein
LQRLGFRTGNDGGNQAKVRPFEQKHIALLSTFADQAAMMSAF